MQRFFTIDYLSLAILMNIRYWQTLILRVFAFDKCLWPEASKKKKKKNLKGCVLFF